MPNVVRKWSKVDQSIRDLFASAWHGQVRWPLYLWSHNPGTGKTCASFAFADIILGSKAVPFQRFSGAFVDAKCGREGWPSQEHFWRYWSRLPLLVLDDIGVRSATESQLESLLGILDARGRAPTILTGNLDLDKLGKVYDGRIFDRIANGGTVVEMLGESRRGT